MRSRSSRSSVGAPALALVVALVLSGCSGADSSQDVAGAAAPREPAATTSPSAPPSQASRPGPGDVQYVALGDSYAAAPGVPRTDQAGGCFRSDANYAHLLAEADDLYLTDMTCTGATSDDVIARQVPSLSADTDLVTIGVGGNDFGLFSTILRSCLSFGGSASDGAGDGDGAELSGTPCTDALSTQVEEVGPEIETTIGTALDAVTAAAPAAEVVVVGYPALLPESGTCPELAPFAAGDYPLLTTIIRSLSDALQAAAQARDLAFVDVYAASAGHDVCSDDPWVNGAQLAPDGTIPFHPFAAEQVAVAALISDLR